MEEYDIENIAGIEEDDGTVICRDCMDEEEWANLGEKKIISIREIAKAKRLYYCEYCQESL